MEHADIDIGYAPKEIISQCSFEFFSDGTCAYRGTEGFEKLVLAELTPSPDTELLAALSEIGPFEIVQGDCIKRTEPHSNLNLNTNEFWAVGRGGRVGHRLRTAISVVNSAIAKHSGRE